LERTVGSVAAHAMTLVWDRPGHAAWCTKLTEHGVVEASSECQRRHPSQVTDYVTCAVVWTHDEWAVVDALSRQMEEAK
jgi:hypothetical protein